MRPLARVLSAGFVLLLLVVGMAHAGSEGRILGTVVDDATGKPLAGVQVAVTSTEFKFRLDYKTDAAGKFTATVLDATRKYQIRLDKEGYRPFEGDLKFELLANKRMTFTMVKVAPVEPEQPKVESTSNQAILAYNDGVAALKANDLTTAAAKFEQAMALDPKLQQAPAAATEVYLQEKRYPEAAAAAEKLLALDPKSERGLSARYDAYKGAGDKEKAKAALEALIQAVPNRDTAIRVFNEGAEASRSGRTDEAIVDLKRAAEIDPKLAPAYSALAGIYLSKKDWKNALAQADALLAIEPENLEGLSARVEAYKGMGDKAKAKEADAAMRAARADQSPQAIYNQGVTQFNANNIAGAKETFEKVLEADPNFARAHYMLGLCYVNLGDSPHAKEHLQKFLELAPNDADAATAKEMLKTM
ncbi:MAG: tetratricopeptide repeat protein [Acidobacteriota bacterium]